VPSEKFRNAGGAERREAVIKEENVIVVDLDGTICPNRTGGEAYEDLVPNAALLHKLRQYKRAGFYIIVCTARNMRTHEGNIGRINATTAKTVLSWLDRHDVPYDEIHFGKPWAGRNGFYVDDRAVRPKEFLEMTHPEILDLISQ
jgi:capsule biosynthesis phosphatase